MLGCPCGLPRGAHAVCSLGPNGAMAFGCRVLRSFNPEVTFWSPCAAGGGGRGVGSAVVLRHPRGLDPAASLLCCLSHAPPSLVGSRPACGLHSGKTPHGWGLRLGHQGARHRRVAVGLTRPPRSCSQPLPAWGQLLRSAIVLGCVCERCRERGRERHRERQEERWVGAYLPQGHELKPRSYFWPFFLTSSSTAQVTPGPGRCSVNTI